MWFNFYLIIYFNFQSTIFCLPLVFQKVTDQEIQEEPIKVIAIGDQITEFYKVKNKIPKINYLQLHLPFIIDEILHLDREIVYITGTTKYIIRPFKEIYMYKENEKILIGKFDHSYNENEVLVQKFGNGDYCSYNKRNRWSAKVTFAGSVVGLKVSKIVEGFLGKYDIRVTGDIFTNKLVFEDTIFINNNEKKPVVETPQQTSSEQAKEYERLYKEFEKKLSSK